MQKKSVNMFHNIEKYLSLSILLVVPLIVLPISPNPFTPVKLLVLTIGVSFLIILKVIRTIIEGKLSISIGSFDLGILLLMIAYSASTYFKTPNMMEAVLLPGTTTLILGSGLLYIFLNQIKNVEKDIISKVLTVVATIYSALSVLAFTGAFSSLKGSFAYLGSRSFTPGGGYLPSLIFLVAILPLTVSLIKSDSDILKRAIWSVMGIAVVFGIGLSIYNLKPGSATEARLLGMNHSWSIAVDTLKESPLLGVGSSNYISSFNRFRPATYNNTNLWNIKFSSARSFMFTTLTETGIIGIVSLLLIFFVVYRITVGLVRNYSLNKSLTVASMLISTICLILFPANELLIILFFALLALNSKTKENSVGLTAKSFDTQEGYGSRWPAIIIGVPVIAIVGVLLYKTTTIASAEYTFKDSLETLGRGESVESYNKMRKAIEKNPLVDRYHASYSQINFALANALAKNAGSDGKELTEDQRNQVSQLIQQAIREARASVALNPYRSSNWYTLGVIYQSIIPLAKGADSFAAQSYAQAVALDPTNPNLRISLGGVFYAAKDYENAIRVFESAVSTKRDLANAHYNLAFAYKESGNMEKAVSEMSVVLSLLDQSKEDYKVAKKVFEEFQSASAKNVEGVEGTELNLTNEAETVLEPKVELTDNEKPPEEVITPSPVEVSGSPLSPTPSVTP